MLSLKRVRYYIGNANQRSDLMPHDVIMLVTMGIIQVTQVLVLLLGALGGYAIFVRSVL